MDKVLIVGVNFTTEHKSQHFDLAMEEMASLVKACDMEPVGRIEQNMESANTATYIGAGKVQEVREMVRALEADLVVFDNGLSPIQLRNLSRDLDCPVMDRTTLILEIFSARAKTREAKLQVEVARLQYMLPRLVGLHDALSRQGGASGAMSNKGAGEKSWSWTDGGLNSVSQPCAGSWKKFQESGKHSAKSAQLQGFRGWRWWGTPTQGNLR